MYVTEIVNGIPVRKLNLWEGWAGQPAKGDVTLFYQLLDHVFKGADPAHKKWFLQWVAYPVQHPGVKLRNAVLIHGPQGSAKTLLGESIAKLYGRAGRLVDQRALERDFNTYMDGAAFIVGDEIATRENRRDLAEHLKNLITRPYVEINKKFINPYTLPNVAQFYLTSNHSDALHLEDDDRRFFVHRVTAGRLAEDFSLRYQPWLCKQSSTNALLHLFMSEVDCTGFNPLAAPPVTEAKSQMVELSRSAHGAWVHQLRLDPDAVPINEYSPLRRVLSLHTIEELLRMFEGNRSSVTAKGMTLALRAEGFNLAYAQGGGVVRLGDGRRARLWAVRNMDRIASMTHNEIVTVHATERGLEKIASKFAVIGGGRKQSK
jgi:hypothetical protein